MRNASIFVQWRSANIWFFSPSESIEKTVFFFSLMLNQRQIINSVQWAVRRDDEHFCGIKLLVMGFYFFFHCNEQGSLMFYIKIMRKHSFHQPRSLCDCVGQSHLGHASVGQVKCKINICSHSPLLFYLLCSLISWTVQYLTVSCLPI